MLTDKELEMLTEYIVEIYRFIEADLLVSIASKFDVYEKIGGSLEWQIRKLQEMGVLNQEIVKIIAKRTQKTEAQIMQMLTDAGYGNLDGPLINKAYEAGQSMVDLDSLLRSSRLKATITDSYKEVKETYRLIQTKALESAKQAYMDVINKSYIATASGAVDYNTAIRKALGEMAEKGITGATYKRGDRIIHYSLEGTVRRDTVTAVHKLANKVSEEACEEMGADYVEISQHLGARVSKTSEIANHAGWQGKVYKIDGFDEKYGNLKNHTGYPDDIQGLGGVNCRHRMYPFFPGISVEKKYHVDEKENEKIYKLSQKQRLMERQIRSYKKEELVFKAAGDEETATKWREKVTAKQKELIAFCKDNNLPRQSEREMISEEY